MAEDNSSAKSEWMPKERGAYLSAERVVEQWLNPDNKNGKNNEKFSLYYFSKDLTASSDDGACRTILFMAGGPGEIAVPGQANFGDLNGYRVVYFHLRGSGFSQVPMHNSFDQYLRTRYAVEDIEAIRNDLGIKKWRGVIGHSYGAVLAQQYAAKYPKKVSKLVLSAPFSRHNSTPDNPNTEIESLKRIYKFEFFKFLESVLEKEKKTNQYLFDEVKKITKRAEEHYGSVQSIIEAYDDFKETLESNNLFYRPEFFKAFRRLRHTGWLPIDEDLFKGSSINVDTAQRYLGLVIARELLAKKEFDGELSKSLSKDKKGDSAKAAVLLNEAYKYFGSPSNTAQRAYYVFSIYDGLNKKLKRSRKKGEEGITSDDVKSIGGKLHVKNPFLGKVGRTRESLKSWDAKDYPIQDQDLPTLILAGEADPVTVGGHAEYIFNEALRGPRMLLQFPGVGHSMVLPPLVDSEYDSRHARDCLLREFFDKDFDKFLKSPIHEAIRDGFNLVGTKLKEELNVKAQVR